MNPGDSLPDASRPGQEAASAGYPCSPSAWPAALPEPQRSGQTVKDIQDIIDRLAAVTRQLRGGAGEKQENAAGPLH